MDHLDGVLFIDYLSKLKRDMIVKKLVKHKKELNKIVYKINDFKNNFYGNPRIFYSPLRALNLEYDVLSVYTQPPKKKFRGQKKIKSPIHLEAEKLNIPVRCPTNLNEEKEYNFIKNSRVKFIVVVAYGQIIPEIFLKIKSLTFLNIHASLLPRWRGAAPIQRSIIEMDKETGLSIMKIIPQLDAGPYLIQESIPINSNDNFSTLSTKLSKLGSKLILKSLNILIEGNNEFIKQQDELVTYAKKITRDEAKIDWKMTARETIAKINGLNPSPGVWLNIMKTELKLLKLKKLMPKVRLAKY